MQFKTVCIWLGYVLSKYTQVYKITIPPADKWTENLIILEAYSRKFVTSLSLKYLFLLFPLRRRYGKIIKFHYPVPAGKFPYNQLLPSFLMVVGISMRQAEKF